MFFYEGVNPNMVCALKVDTRCKGWCEITSNILSKFRGVSYDVDAKKGMVYISGKVNPQKILDKVSKNAKNVKLCWIRSRDQYIDGNNMDQRGTLTMPTPSACPYYVEPPYPRGYFTPPPPSMPYYQYHSYEPIYMPPQLPLCYHSQMPYYY